MSQRRKLAWRECALLLTTLGLWQFQSAELGYASPLVWCCALSTILCGFLFHEWGHVYGAIRSSATIYFTTSLLSPFVYNFDSNQNSREQFLQTAFWGFAATAMALLATQFLLPESHAATSLIQYGVMFLAALTVIFEFPIAALAYFGRPVPSLRLTPDERPPDHANP